MAEINAKDVKDLRDRTQAGFMECKHALEEANGDTERAIDVLRKQGLAKAEKKAARVTNQGVIYSYIHGGGRIGVMLELNCETDFVARTEEFKSLAHELALQICATDPRWIVREDVPQGVIEREKGIYCDQAKASGKPEKVVDKIVEGKLEKFFEESCLVEQQYIRDDKVRVKELIANVIHKTGENVRLRRFMRYQLGEELE